MKFDVIIILYIILFFAYPVNVFKNEEKIIVI